MGRGRVLLEPMEGGTEGAEVGREEVVVVLHKKKQEKCI